MYCLVEAHDGEFPLLKVYRNVQGLINRMAELEGKDVTVWPFYGIPIQFSMAMKGARIIFMPDDQAMTTKPIDNLQTILDSEVPLQEDRFLGDPVLAAALAAVDEDVAREEALAGQVPDPPDEEDENDDDAEQGARR